MASHSAEQSCACAARAAADKRERLARTIQGEIIPRLMLAHASADLALGQPSLRAAPLSEDDVHEFARLLALDDPAPSKVFAEVVRGHGLSWPEVCLNLFGPAAKWLGDLWLDDHMTWAEVTIGLTRLHQMTRQLTMDHWDCHRPFVGRAALALAPEEQHCLGVCILEQFLSHAGWDTHILLSTSHPDCVDVFAAEHFDVIGFSLGRDEGLEQLGAAIDRARSLSRNPKVSVVVGGHTFCQNPRLVRHVGADGLAMDAAAAVELFERFRSRAWSESSV